MGKSNKEAPDGAVLTVPLIGLQFADWKIQAVNRTGSTLTIGQVVVIDFPAASEAVAAAYDTGVATDPLACVRLITANVATGVQLSTTAAGAIAVLCADVSILDNATGDFWVRSANVQASVTTGIIAGDALTLPSVAGALVLTDGIQAFADLAAGETAKIVGYAHEADDTTVAMVMFDGFNGFGSFTGPQS